MFKNRKNKKGFSLVELIIVIAILAVLAIVLVPTLTKNVEKSRAQKSFLGSTYRKCIETRLMHIFLCKKKHYDMLIRTLRINAKIFFSSL